MFQKYNIDDYEILNDINNFMCDVLSERDWSHGIEHSQEVAKNSIFIWRNGESDRYSEIKGIAPISGDPLIIIVAAALLHDVCDHKYAKTAPLNIAVDMKNFLKNEIGSSNEKAVDEIIRNISYSKELKKGCVKMSNPHLQHLRNVVSDSDKLEALGEIGVKRCIAYQQETSDNKEQNLSESQVKQIAINHISNTLLKLYPDYFKTEKGKEMAKERHKYISHWVEENKS